MYTVIYSRSQPFALVFFFGGGNVYVVFMVLFLYIYIQFFFVSAVMASMD